MSEHGKRLDELSERQKEILRLVGQHWQAKEVARKLNIGVTTVRTHMTEARRKLGVATSREAARALLEFERGPALINDERPQAMRIPDTLHDQPRSGHEQAFRTEPSILHDPVGRTGDGLADVSDTRQASPGRRHTGNRDDVGADVRPGKSGLQYGRRHRLADRRWALFERRLEALSLWQWFGLALLASALLAMAGGVLVQAALVIFEGLNRFQRQSG